MILELDSNQFMRDMNNIIKYSVGFLDGVEKGKVGFLSNLAKTSIEALKEFVDSNARVDPAALAHMYEWNQSGSPDARLYNLDYTIVGPGLTVNSTFRQSQSIKDGSLEPFYDKARIMEYGVPVTIAPKRSDVLAFEQNGEMIFTKSPVTVSNPGGVSAQGSYEEVFNNFFNKYFTQSFIVSSGIFSHLQNPVDYKTNLHAGKSGGRSIGLNVGYQWISRGGLLT